MNFFIAITKKLKVKKKKIIAYCNILNKKQKT